MEEAGVQGTLSRPLSLYNLYHHQSSSSFRSVINRRKKYIVMYKLHFPSLSKEQSWASPCFCFGYLLVAVVSAATVMLRIWLVCIALVRWKRMGVFHNGDMCNWASLSLEAVNTTRNSNRPLHLDSANRTALPSLPQSSTWRLGPLAVTG